MSVCVCPHHEPVRVAMDRCACHGDTATGACTHACHWPFTAAATGWSCAVSGCGLPPIPLPQAHTRLHLMWQLMCTDVGLPDCTLPRCPPPGTALPTTTRAPSSCCACSWTPAAAACRSAARAARRLHRCSRRHRTTRAGCSWLLPPRSELRHGPAASSPASARCAQPIGQHPPKEAQRGHPRHTPT